VPDETNATPAPETDLQARLTQTEQLLAQAREALDASERRRQIERHLLDEHALDLDTAALLTEAAVTAMHPADIRAAVADLKRRKPFLFRPHAPRHAGAMGTASPTAADPLHTAAAHARDTGDRRALLSYLRLRRGA
jgi:hypothetical protein